jgi:chromosome partitioning protein
MTIIYSFVNQKGGVGKTTTVINLGAYLAEADQKVLIVDLDPQANATACLGVDKVLHGTYEIILNRISPTDCILHNPRLKLSILPSTPALAGARVELVELSDREYRMRHALETLDRHYDYILIDCPPSLGLLTVNGLLAALNGVIIPIQCEYLALEGLSQLMQTLDHARIRLHPNLIIRGMVLTMFDVRTNLAQDVVEEVKRHFPELVFQSIIPRSVRLAEAPSHGLPISTYAPNSSGAIAYRALAEELLAQDLKDIKRKLQRSEEENGS